MKKLKLLSVFIILTLIFFTGINEIKAVSVGDKVTYHIQEDGGENGTGFTDAVENAGINITFNNEAYHVWNYFINYEGRQSKIYCVDPTKSNDKDGLTTMEITELVDFSNQDIDLVDKALYYGLYTILTNSPKDISNNVTSLRAITAVDLAVRAYYNAIMGKGLDSSDAPVGGSARNLVNMIGINVALNNATKVSFILGTCQKSTESATRECLQDRLKYGYKEPDSYHIDQWYLDTANKYIQEAIDAAYEFKLNGGNVAKVDVWESSTNNIYNEETKTYDTEQKIVNFRIQDLPSDGLVYLRAHDIFCTRCSLNGISMSKIEYKDGNEWKLLSDNFQIKYSQATANNFRYIDLSKYVDSNNIAQLRITLKKTESENEDCDVRISLKYSVYDPRYQDAVVLLKNNTPGPDGKIPDNQRYVGLVDNGNNNFVGEYSGGHEQTKYLYSDISCMNKSCSSELASPVCGSGASGYVNAPTNVKKCIIDNNDEAGNTYKLLDSNNGVDNKYCSTFCKEDYQKIHFNNTIRNLNCGGYFKLKAEIEGTQDCYRSSTKADDSINQEQFIKDLEEIQREFVNEFNRYQKASSALAQGISNYEGREFFSRGSYTGYTVVSVNADGSINIQPEVMNYDYRFNSSNEVENAIKADLEGARKNLEPTTSNSGDTIYSEYNRIIDSYNACTTSWNNTFKFAQKIGWNYSEYINGKLQETYSKLLSADERYLEGISSTLKTSVTIQACTGSVDDTYSLCNGSANNWQNVENVFGYRTFKICNIYGCGDDTKAVSNATYVKQHSYAYEEYITPNVFYQIPSSGPVSGGITTNKNYTGPNNGLTQVEGLPLSLDSVGGGIFEMHLEDLGEFYDTGELGRLIDYQGKNENSSVAKVSGATELWNGDYKCEYYNNCMPGNDPECDPDIDPDCPTPPPTNPTCPQCEFYCEGEYCEWRDCPTCDTECVNCIYNFGELQLNMKSVSISNFTSGGREYGYNWNINTLTGDIANQLKLIQDKAKETIEKIQESNTTIYDDTNVDSEDSKLEFSIKLTPNVTNYIRDYNKKIDSENVGGYNNPTLQCYNYETTNADGTPYVAENVFCYSTFIDDLITNTNANVYAGKRGDISNRTATSVLNSGYWEPWDQNHDKMSKYDGAIGGPSWK